MHNREGVIELLTGGYGNCTKKCMQKDIFYLFRKGADISVRDYSGKIPNDYLPNKASSNCQSKTLNFI